MQTPLKLEEHHQTLCSTHAHLQWHISMCTFPVQSFTAILQWTLGYFFHKPTSLLPTGDTQPLNTTAAAHLQVPQQLETAHRHMPLLGKAAPLTSIALLTRVQVCPKTRPLPCDYHHTLFPLVTPTQASASP